jgi:hypothetical protein
VAALVASENLASGAIVNIHTVSGAARAQNANATDDTKPAHGFVAAAVASGGTATVYFSGQINGALTGLTPGAVCYLDTSAGGIAATPPAGAGNMVQRLGVALSATQLLFVPDMEGVSL